MLRFDLNAKDLSDRTARHYIALVEVIGAVSAAAPAAMLAGSSIFCHAMIKEYGVHVPEVMHQRAVNGYLITLGLACAGAYALTITAITVTTALRSALMDRVADRAG